MQLNTFSRALESLESRRLLDAGAFDPALGGGVAVTTGFAAGSSVLNDLVVLGDGGVLAGGYCIPQVNDQPEPPQLALAKYTFNGELDSTFGTAGQVIATPRGLKNALDLAILDDGSLLVLGSSVSGFSTRGNLILKLTPDGRVDTTFGKNGKIPLPLSATSVQVGPQNSILVAGQIEQDGAIALYSSRGGLELSFGDQGLFTTRNLFTLEGDTTFFFDSLAIDSNGLIYAGGSHRDAHPVAGRTVSAPIVASEFDVRVVRVQPTGTLDPTFAGRGFFSAVTDLSAVVPSDGAAFGTVTIGSEDLPIVAASNSSGDVTYVARLEADGTVRQTFSEDGVALFSTNPSRYPLTGSLLEQGDGKILFAGITEREGRNIISVERLNADGARDETYGAGGVSTVTYKKIPSEARVAALAPDGSIVLGGLVGTVEADGSNDSRRFTLARLLSEDGPAGQLIPKTLRVEQTGFVFDIIWRDDEAVNIAALDGSDLRLFGPDDVSRRARLSAVTASDDGRVVTARYRMPAPEGQAFTRADNGWYAVKLMSGQVSDVLDNFAARRTLGSIRIRIL